MTIRLGAEFQGRIVAMLRDGTVLHSLLVEVQTETGPQVGRLPIEQLKDGGRQRAGSRLCRVDRLGRGDELNARVIQFDRKRPGRFLLSERAFYFHKLLDRLQMEPGWREEWPDENAWYFTKGRLRAIVRFGSYTIIFRRAPLPKPAAKPVKEQTMRYDLRMTADLSLLLQNIISELGAAVSQDGVAQALSASFHQQWEALMERLQGDDAYLLRQELTRARYRNLDSDPFSFGVPEPLRIKCEYNPAVFTQVIRDLTNPQSLAKRARLVESAWSAGVNPYGLTNDQIRSSIDLCLEGDMAAFEELVLDESER